MRNEDFRDFGNAADVLQTVVIIEAEIGIEAAAEIVAIKNDGEATLLVEHTLGGVGDGGFPGAGQPAEPHHGAPLAEKVFLILAMKEAVELRVDVHEVDA